jgi:hypothetical protein
VGDDPVGAVDLLGMIIICECIDDYLSNNGLSGWIKDGNRYKASSGLRNKYYNIRSEILYKMIKSKRVFKIKESSLTELKRHINARIEIVNSAKNSHHRLLDFHLTV